jgi:hypothetical protein
MFERLIYLFSAFSFVASFACILLLFILWSEISELKRRLSG